MFQKMKFRRWTRLTVQFLHLLMALGMLITAIVEFSAKRPLFDLLGNYADIPSEVETLFFQVGELHSSLSRVVYSLLRTLDLDYTSAIALLAVSF